jgi:hypothetical protein
MPDVSFIQTGNSVQQALTSDKTQASCSDSVVIFTLVETRPRKKNRIDATYTSQQTVDPTQMSLAEQP